MNMTRIVFLVVSISLISAATYISYRGVGRIGTDLNASTNASVRSGSSGLRSFGFGRVK